MADPKTTAEGLANHCRVQSNVDQTLRLLDVFNAECRAHGITLASQLCFVAYWIAEMDAQSPQKDIIAPALQRLIERNIAALRLADAPPKGRA